MGAQRDLSLAIRTQIRKLRLQAAMTQTQMAAAAGLGTSRICRIETGKSELTLIEAVRLTDALGVSLTALLGPIPGARRKTKTPTH